MSEDKWMAIRSLSRGVQSVPRTTRISGCEEKTLSTEDGASSTPWDALVRGLLRVAQSLKFGPTCFNAKSNSGKKGSNAAKCLD